MSGVRQVELSEESPDKGRVRDEQFSGSVVSITFPVLNFKAAGKHYKTELITAGT